MLRAWAYFGDDDGGFDNDTDTEDEADQSTIEYQAYLGDMSSGRNKGGASEDGGSGDIFSVLFDVAFLVTPRCGGGSVCFSRLCGSLGV